VFSCGPPAAVGYWFRFSEEYMRFQFESAKDTLWGVLALLGCLVSLGILAVAFKLSLGKW